MKSYLNISVDFTKNAQHCLVSMTEKWRESMDNGGTFGAVMTDLSKVSLMLMVLI